MIYDIDPIRDRDGNLLAIVVEYVPHKYADESKYRVQFLTTPDQPQQLAYINRKRGDEIQRHYHPPQEREVIGTPETLIIKSGRLQVDFYDVACNLVRSKVISKQAIVTLLSGGHGFKVLEDCEFFEVKQGPYNPKLDKVTF